MTQLSVNLSICATSFATEWAQSASNNNDRQLQHSTTSGLVQGLIEKWLDEPFRKDRSLAIDNLTIEARSAGVK